MPRKDKGVPWDELVAGGVLAWAVAFAASSLIGAMPYGPGSISLRSTEPLRVSSAHAVTIPIAFGEPQ